MDRSRSAPFGVMLADGRRLHLHHGPIDLVVEAFGTKSEVEAAYEQAARFFDGVLHGLVDGEGAPAVNRMVHAVCAIVLQPDD